ncbi:hypothetical protein ACFW1A_19475 [Kitasatospora sp. NPDC058965]|uniref:hypothetical protein n=1 Tax=Kitasatospora sp. NPDC058965 TaxID=3346682 RepID=UPI0036746FE6
MTRYTPTRGRIDPVGNTFGGDGRDLRMSNGGTAVFVETLMLAVSDLARRPWEVRFAALIAGQDQSVFGLGVVGFDLVDLEWGADAAERAANKAFVLRVVELAAWGYRWAELGYCPPFVGEQLHEYHRMVDAFDPGAAAPGPDGGLPAPADVVDRRCPQHRVLAPLDWLAECVFCTRGD